MQGRHHSPETRAKIAAKATGRLVGEETRRKISASLEGKPARSLGMKFPGRGQGRKATEETRQKLSAARLGGKNHNARAVDIHGVIYPSVMDAVRQTAYSHMQIQYRLAKGIFRYVDDPRGKDEPTQLPLL